MNVLPAAEVEGRVFEQRRAWDAFLGEPSLAPLIALTLKASFCLKYAGRIQSLRRSKCHLGFPGDILTQGANLFSPQLTL